MQGDATARERQDAVDPLPTASVRRAQLAAVFGIRWGVSPGAQPGELWQRLWRDRDWQVEVIYWRFMLTVGPYDHEAELAAAAEAVA